MLSPSRPGACTHEYAGRVRVIVRAAEVARGNRLPAPFNVAQGGVALAGWVAVKCCRRAPKRKVCTNDGITRSTALLDFWHEAGRTVVVTNGSRSYCLKGMGGRQEHAKRDNEHTSYMCCTCLVGAALRVWDSIAPRLVP